MLSIILVLLSSLALCWPAAADPVAPSITWDWYNAGVTYLHYPKKGPNDAAIAAHYFRLAAKDGNSSAAYKLGDMYENGLGVPKSYKQAFKFYSMAADRGDKYGEFRVGWFYQHGLGVKHDAKMAAKWYEKAARDGNVWGFHMLGFLFADGEGVHKNVELAKQYLEFSIPKTNDSWAEWKLAQLIKDDDPKRARRLLEQAASAGNAQAKKDLRKMGVVHSSSPSLVAVK